ncbi:MULTISPECIES: helix-turn-helix transcriptional regulator [Bacillus]|uniref:Transcriptional regulator n=1 Tax=Bacillus pseudomycoides TaxID=64104 RepID=A0A1Y3MHN7_9BACI|nr:helix-turn-helix transcriptional regulator [Bacillus pseudomycoides]OUM49334.1 transcriptional regulator [Bacillus pseudomycoides]
MRIWLIKTRKNMNKTQEDIANEARISRSMYAMVENGKRDPSVTVAKNIAAILSVEWTLFFE